MKQRTVREEIAAGAILLAGAVWLRLHGDLTDPKQIPGFLAAAAAMGAAFLLALRVHRTSAGCFWVVAVAARLLLLSMPPGADLYRYLWEGAVQNAGYSPYCLAPDSEILTPLRDAHWLLVEHKSVPAIYPPLAELVFRTVTRVSRSVLAVKSLIAAADLGLCWLLFLRLGAGVARGYAWNPLVIYSFAGGGHYDSLFLLAVMSGVFYWESNRRLASVVWLGASVALKWVSLPVVVWALWRILRLGGVRRAAAAALASVLPFLLSWVVVAWGNWSCPLAPVEFARVARSAEALPAIASWLLASDHFLNTNGAWLLLFFVLAGVLLRRQSAIQQAARTVFDSALLTTPMFHAWYATWITPLLLREERRATIALSLSAFVYFWLHYTVGQPGGIWKQSVWEKLLLWAPFVAGLFADWRASRPPGISKARDTGGAAADSRRHPPDSAAHPN